MSRIRVIGFDLDQTLYPKSPLIDEAIQKYIYEQIALHKKISIEKARELFYTHYPTSSGSATLARLGIPNPKEIVQEALERANIAEFLHPNPRVHTLLQDLRREFGSISLITGSNAPIAMKKLHSLQIPREWFEVFITGETPKTDGTAFRAWLRHYMDKDPSLRPEHFLYVGDRYPADVEHPLALGMRACLVNISKVNPECPVPQYPTLFDVRKSLE